MVGVNALLPWLHILCVPADGRLWAARLLEAAWDGGDRHHVGDSTRHGAKVQQVHSYAGWVHRLCNTG